jgi:lipoprotein-anchoring transpeptidase ErfK/SrfK
MNFKVKLLTVFSLLLLSVMVLSRKSYAATMITYDFTQYTIPEGQPTTLNVDETTVEMWKANPVYINAFVDALSARYNTQTAVINKTLEVTYLVNVINGTALAGNHIPSYVSALSTSMVDNTNSGESYVDVNITTQTLTLYVNGQATLVTPVVTGNPNKGNGTPTGRFSVLNKQRNRTLIGKNNSYRTFVNMWERVTGNVGIHDASSWRSQFGGSIYKTNGSHGCINTPIEAMRTIYDSTEVGTPVYIHY